MGVPTIIRANLDAGDVVLAEGSVLRGNSSGVAAAHSAKSSGYVLVGDGTTVTSVDVTGDIDLSSGGVASITAASIVNADLANSASTTSGLMLVKYAMVTYDFAVDGGGAPGVITPALNATVPDNAVVELVNYDVITTCTSAGDTGTLKVSLVTDGDLSTAIAINDASNPWDAGAQKATAVTQLPKKTTAARSFTVTTATQAFTAGKVVFTFRYYVTE